MSIQNEQETNIEERKKMSMQDEQETNNSDNSKIKQEHWVCQNITGTTNTINSVNIVIRILEITYLLPSIFL